MIGRQPYHPFSRAVGTPPPTREPSPRICPPTVTANLTFILSRRRKPVAGLRSAPLLTLTTLHHYQLQSARLLFVLAYCSCLPHQYSANPSRADLVCLLQLGSCVPYSTNKMNPSRGEHGPVALAAEGYNQRPTTADANRQPTVAEQIVALTIAAPLPGVALKELVTEHPRHSSVLTKCLGA
ncbi:hypothetical protein LINGRAHAP2_LOCUS24093 [Linum grandiflorum]